MAKRPRKKLTTKIGKLVENTPFWLVGVLILGIILSCAAYFYVESPQLNGTNNHNLDGWDSIYFSIITFSSLGYGDILPVGFGKAVAAFEVLSGLILLAFFVGKLASERQLALLLLVYTSDQQRRLSEFQENISELNASMLEAASERNQESIKTLAEQSFIYTSSVCSYLILQANQGDIAAYGNIFVTQII